MRSLCKCLGLVVLVILASLTAAAQQPWEKIAPVGESFSVLMPEKANEETRLIPLNEKDRVPERVYYSGAGGKRYMVVSFRKTSPDRLLALSSLDNFLSSMEQAFKSGDGETPKSLSFDREVSLENYSARQYHIRVGQYAGVARFLGAENAFYALMVIGAEESDADASRFLSSFRPGKPNTSSESSGIRVSVPNESDDAPTISRIPAPGTLPPEPWPDSVAPIMGGVLNGKAISLPLPKYPKEAKKARDSGLVEVQIIIDEQGNVIKAKAISGPASLREVCVAAALSAHFSPTRLSGQPVKVSGRITYRFVAQ